MSASPKTPRVADFSTHLSGPIASRHMVSLGADVIKIEHPRVGDGNRDFPPYFHDDGVHHLQVNPGTRSLTVDSRSDDWPRVVQAIARWADVVIVGNRPSNAQRLGIDFASMSRHNPQLVYCLITGYGLQGDWAGLPAHGLNMDAYAGTVPLEAHAPGDPRPDVPAHYRSVGTTLAGVEAALGIYAALHKRAQGCGGQVVHLSVWESALSWMWRDVVTHANLGRPWTPYRELGSRYCMYGTRDDKAILVCPIEKHFWHSFCELLELPSEVRERGDWTSGSDMGEQYIALGERELIEKRMRTRTLDEWVRGLSGIDVPFAPVLDWREAMDSTHAAANGVMSSYEYRGRRVRVGTTPVSVTPTSQLAGSHEALAQAHRDKAAQVHRPPLLGEHNDEVLRELGLR